MVFRPTGLIAFTEFDVRKLLEPRGKPGGPDAEPARPAQVTSEE
jgi:hypothetical protein